jgi:hypothetical protein
MKTASVIVAIGLSLAWNQAHAQAQKPAAAPQPEKKAAPAAAAKEPAKPAAETKAELKPAAKEPAKPMATAARKSRAAEDARECLQQGTNTEIIKCAEKFL